MHLLVATRRGQGQRDNDFHHAVDGEVVYLGVVCARDEEDPDGGCGCGRAFVGLNSGKATTTAEVRDVPFTREDVALAMQSSFEQHGWAEIGVNAEADGFVDELIELGQEWPVGTVVERRIDDVNPRL
ncbi:hypothetical protein [Micromonospora chersina]|uniref:DUF7715 family protein n=1 Tax=Micromonospora chersina TaxID=47854 RepID=UPI003711FC32